MDNKYSDYLPRFLEKDLEHFRCCSLDGDGCRCDKSAIIETTTFLEKHCIDKNEWVVVYYCEDHAPKSHLKEANGEFGN